MASELRSSRVDGSATLILIREHSIKLLSEFISLYLQISAALCPHQTTFYVSER